VSVTSIRFTCASCGRELRARADAEGRHVRCPGCGERTAVVPHREEAPGRGFRIGWPWLAGAGAFVVLAAVAGLAVGVLTGRTPRAVADSPPGGTPIVSSAPPKTDLTVATTTPSIRKNESQEKTGTGPPPPSASDWKLTNALVRTGPRVLGDFNRVITADEGYEMVEVFCDIDAAPPARDAGFDVLAVTLAVRDGSKPNAEPVRRAAVGYALLDDGPELTSYVVPTTMTVGKAGDSFEVSQKKNGVALKVYPRATGDQTGPIRLAPKQNPTRLGFAFTVPKGNTPIELRLADAVLPLGSTAPPAPTASSDPDLEGTWRLVKLYDQYEPGNQSYLLVSSHYVMTVKGTEMSTETEDGGKKKATKYTLATDRSKTPRVYHETGPSGKAFSGIYKVEGNKLIMCSQKDGTPPAEFSAHRDDGKGRRIMEYERVK
jgi:uncharacterized protein (TIGR03067 family)